MAMAPLLALATLATSVHPCAAAPAPGEGRAPVFSGPRTTTLAADIDPWKSIGFESAEDAAAAGHGLAITTGASPWPVGWARAGLGLKTDDVAAPGIGASYLNNSTRRAVQAVGSSPANR